MRKRPAKAVDLASKASRYRSAWKKRMMKLNMDMALLPETKLIKKWLTDQYPYKCYISGGFLSPTVIEIDHKVPLSRGGSPALANLGVTSRFYNNAKGDMTDKEFRQLIRLISKWEDKGQSLLLRLIKSNKIFSRRK